MRHGMLEWPEVREAVTRKGDSVERQCYRQMYGRSEELFAGRMIILKAMWMWVLVCAASCMTAYSQVNLMHLTDQCGTYTGVAISNYPPIQPDMTWEEALAFCIADSTCRIMNTQQLKDELANLSYDSLRVAVEAMLKLRRYYPLWMIHVLSMPLDSYPLDYRMTYGDVYNEIMEAYLRRNTAISNKEKDIISKDAVLVGEISTISHDSDSTMFPYEGSRRCYSVRILERIIGGHIYPVEGEEPEVIVISVYYYRGLVLPGTSLGYDFDKNEYDKLEVGGRYLFLLDILHSGEKTDCVRFHVYSYPGSFFRISDDSIVSVFKRFGDDGDVVPLSEAVRSILRTYNNALGK